MYAGTTVNQDEIQQALSMFPVRLRGQKLLGYDFSGRNMKKADLKGSSLVGAKFIGTDLTEADLEGCNCYGADFTNANCHRTNFKDAVLTNAKMRCKDLYGATFTFECKSFKDIEIDPGWWYGFLMYALMMQPPNQEAKEKLIQCIGVDRWRVLREQYASRQM